MAKYATYGDALLLRLLQQSDETAFTEIYDRYWPRMYAVALFHFKSPETAEDILHDIFLALWRRREVLEITSLAHYLATAVKHRVFDEITRAVKQRGLQPVAGTAENDAAFRLLLSEAQQGLNRLPSKTRIVFTASRLQGKRNKEIAAELSLSEKAVEKHLTRALRALRAQLRSF